MVRFGTSLFLYPSVFCCCILELKNKKNTTCVQHFSSVLQYFGGGLVAFPSLMGRSTRGQDRDLPPAEGACEDRAIVAVHALSTTWAWSSLSCSAQSEALSSTQPFSSLGFSVNEAHLGCFFALLQASCSITASTQRRLGLDYFHSFLVLKGMAFRSRDLASIFIKFPFSEVGRKKPHAGAARGWVGALPAGSDATRQQPQRNVALSSPPNSAGFFVSFVWKGLGFPWPPHRERLFPVWGEERFCLFPRLQKLPAWLPAAPELHFCSLPGRPSPEPSPGAGCSRRKKKPQAFSSRSKPASKGQPLARAVRPLRLASSGNASLQPVLLWESPWKRGRSVDFFFFFSR